MRQVYKPILSPIDHQAFGTSKMLESKLGNFDEQGLGKTKQAYDLVGELLAAKKIDLVFFIVKASLRENIFNEIINDADQLTPLVIRGNRSTRVSAYRHITGNVLILSYDTIVRDLDFLTKIMQLNRVALCFDESHYLKNIHAERTKAAIEISRLAKKCLIFSGTPIPNRVEDIFPQLKLLGYEIGSDAKEFKANYPNVDDIRALMVGKFIRRKKSEVKGITIPKKNIRKISVNMEPLQAKLYEQIRKDLQDFYLKGELKRKFLPVSQICTKLLRLNQIASNPGMLFEGYAEVPGKIRAIEKIIKRSKRNDKIIIWTSFRMNVDYLIDYFKSSGITSLHGGLNKTEREKNVSEFMNNHKIKLLVATPQCAREGFTLTSANIAVYLDRSFSSLDWSQSQDRIHRISQKKVCEILVLESKDTVDQHIDKILERKGKLQAYLLGEDESLSGETTYTISEILNILGTSNNSIA